MKLLILTIGVLFSLSSFANTAKFQNNVLDLLNDSIHFGYITSYSALDFVGTNVDGDETYKLSYTRPIFGDGGFDGGDTEAEEIIGSETLCEYIAYSEEEEDFLFTNINCSVPFLIASGALSDSSSAEISEVLQTNAEFSHILDYEAPLYMTTLKDEINGDLEIFQLDYVNTDNKSFCEFIIFDPETKFLSFTGVSCNKPVDEVIEEGLKQED